MRIASILNEKEITLSCEVFPPKHFDGIAQASAVAQEIAGLHPSFMSVTYGAAGSTPGHTIAVAKAVAETGVTPLCHLTCVQSTREHVQHVLADMKTAGMENVLALRGDLPKEGEPCHDFAYAAELIDFIHQQGDFCVGAACYPEGHPESGSRAKDMDYLRRKVEAGVDFLTTQMFFDNGLLYNFLYRMQRAGMDIPVCAGIMPICDARGNASADVARTYLLFCLSDQAAADKYMDLFCEKTGTAKRYVQQWLPLVAAAQLTKKRLIFIIHQIIKPDA